MTNRVYAKLLMQTSASANEESFVIKSGDTVIYTSPQFEDSTLRTIQQCFLKTENNQFTIQFFDAFGDSWSYGSYLEVRGEYGNTVFKNYMTALSSETYELSLYYAIKKSSTWKFKAASVGLTWIDIAYDDMLWTDVVGGSVPFSAEGPHFFRKSFKGLGEMAAIDLRLKYSEGIVAYINGVEMWRDNMPAGAVNVSTLASGSYAKSDYRGVVRSSGNAQLKTSVIAVELHYIDAESTSVKFDAWMAFLKPSVAEGDCFAYPDMPQVTGDGSNSQRALNWIKTDYMSHSLTPSGATIDFIYSGLVMPFVNGIRIYPGTYVDFAPRDFVLSSSITSGTSVEYTQILSVTGWTYMSKTHMLETSSAILPGPTNSYRMYITASSTTSLQVSEVQLLVCNVSPPLSIIFTAAVTVAYLHYTSVDIRPVKAGFTNCTIKPDLPIGIDLTTDCSITGVAEAVLSLTVFTITTTMYGGISGVVTLSVQQCDGSMIEIRREYKKNANTEGFEVRDATSNDIVFSRGVNGGQISDTVEINNLCVTVSRVIVTLSGSNSFWSRGSFLYISSYVYGDITDLLLRVRYDTYLGLKTSYIVAVTHVIKSHEPWFYSFGAVPDNWFSDSVTGWSQAVAGTFPDATARIQIYKKSFMVTSLDDTAGIVIALQYKFACVVYLNGHEAYRKGLTGNLADTSMALESYSGLMFRFVSLPLTTIASPSVNYVKQGSNTIAIALVAITSTQTASTFDCTVRLMATTEVSRLVDFSVDGWLIAEPPEGVFDQSYSTYIKNSRCEVGIVQVTFENDRREWVSSIMIQDDYSIKQKLVNGFLFEARNAGDADWTLLKNVTGLTWSTPGQKRKIWVENNKPFNQYRWRNFVSREEDCAWKVQELDIFSDHTTDNIPELAYESITIYKNIEMAELYPSSSLYADFSVNPNLPIGIVIDPHSGVISGTATELMAVTQYTVTASKVTSGSTTTTLTLTVSTCHDGKNLITFVLKTDNRAYENSYRLYRGRDVMGTPFKAVSPLPVSSGLMYVDICMPHAIYTFQATDSHGDGWSVGSGGSMTIDQGSLIVNMFMVPNCEGSPCVVNVPFSTLMPFQINYDDWKLYRGTMAVPTDWKDVTFDDKIWIVTKAASIGTNSAITTYLRRSFIIPSLADYHVMNAHIKFAGGVVAYFNGNIVARFNMPDTYDANTESLLIYDSSKYASFHVILTMAGAVEGVNVVSFEVHRPVGGSSADDVEFDASAVFGVEDCSIVVDSYTDVTGSTPRSGTLTDMLELSVTSSCSFEQKDGQYIAWTVANQEGSLFNSYGFIISYTVNNWGFSLFGRLQSGDVTPSESPNETADEFMPLSRVPPLVVNDRIMDHFDVPVGIIGFRQFKWVSVNAPSTTMSIYSLYTQYCVTSGAVCPAIDQFPAVTNGQISPAMCPKGYKGYLYRICDASGVLSDVKTDRCIPIRPENIHYLLSRFVFVNNTAVTTGVPTYDNIIDSFYVDENVKFPDGLTLDVKTGEIFGTPSLIVESAEFVIFGRNAAGITSCTIVITVRRGTCHNDGVWLKTEIGVVALYQCSTQGSYFGSMTRTCSLGEKDGVWGKTSGMCVSVFTIVLIIFVVVVIILSAIFILIRINKKAKAVGGVKGKRVVIKTAPKEKIFKNTVKV